MKTEDMELPDGWPHARFIDGVREMAQYDPAWDRFVVRWDMVKGEHQVTIDVRTEIGEIRKKEEIAAWADAHRAEAIAKLHDLLNIKPFPARALRYV